MDFTGERLMPFIQGQIAIEHLHRYALTYNFIAGKDVLDIASGEGYGSSLMASVAKSITGVDIDPEAVKHASETYRKPNLRYLHGSATQIPIASATMDVVVSFETIEHLNEHQLMMEEIKRVLRPDGLVIISSPDKKFYTEQQSHYNDYHCKELYFEEFEKLIRSNFSSTRFYFQGFAIASIIYSNENKTTLKQYSGNYDSVKCDSQVNYLYNLAICSNGESQLEMDNSLFNSKELYFGIEDYYSKIIDSIYRSKSYRFGNFFVNIYNLLFKHKK